MTFAVISRYARNDTIIEALIHSKSRRFAAGAICFIVGVALASGLGLERQLLFYLLIILFVLLFSLILFWQKLEIRLICFGLLWLLTGAGRFVLAEPASTPDNLPFYNGRLVELTGIVSEVSGNQQEQKLTVKINSLKNILASDAEPRAVRGQLLIITDSYPRYRYGDELRISCALEAPKVLTNFDYPKYLAKQGIWSICYHPKIKFLGSGRGNYLIAKLFSWRELLTNSSNRLLPEPASSLLSGLLLGAQANFSPSLQAAFNRAGLTHLVAVSGYNVTIILSALLTLTAALGLARRRAFWLATFGLICFIILTGASAATVRAGIMGWLLLLAKHLGRTTQIGRILLATAALMLLFNPYYLFYDVGWQLSFLALLGLAYITPLYNRAVSAWPEFWGLKEVLTTTLGAITAVTPIMIYQFGQLSIIAPLVNLLVLPIVPLAMALGTAALAAHLLWLPLGRIFGFLIWLVLNYIVRLAEFFSSLKFASVALPVMPWWLMIVFYVIMGWLVIKYLKTHNS